MDSCRRRTDVAAPKDLWRSLEISASSHQPVGSVEVDPPPIHVWFHLLWHSDVSVRDVPSKGSLAASNNGSPNHSAALWKARILVDHPSSTSFHNHAVISLYDNWRFHPKGEVSRTSDILAKLKPTCVAQKTWTSGAQAWAKWCLCLSQIRLALPTTHSQPTHAGCTRRHARVQQVIGNFQLFRGVTSVWWRLDKKTQGWNWKIKILQLQIKFFPPAHCSRCSRNKGGPNNFRSKVYFSKRWKPLQQLHTLMTLLQQNASGFGPSWKEKQLVKYLFFYSTQCLGFLGWLFIE